MKSKCKVCICSFSQGAEVVFLTTSSCTDCSHNNIVLNKSVCARHFQRVNLSNDFHTGGDDACFDWRVPFPS